MNAVAWLPRWSKDIIEETRRTLETKLGLTPALTAHYLHQLEVHFADAWVEGYDSVIPAMANDPKDRMSLRPPINRRSPLPIQAWLCPRALRNSLETHWRAVSFFVSFVRKADYLTMDISGNSTPG